MQIRTKVETIEEQVMALSCDRCGKHSTQKGDDIPEFQEFLRIDYEAGYGSVFPDESRVRGDFCQHCLKELLGPWLRIS